MSKNLILLSVTILLFVSSCTVYKEFPIDIYKPGEVAIPPEAKNAAIVYRNFKYEGDTLQNYYKDDFRLKKAKNDPENIDSVLVSACVKELAKNFKSKNTFDEIRIFPELFKPHYGKKLPPLSFNVVNKLTESSQSDILISLETFSYFYSEYSSTSEIPSKSNEVITAAVWAVYNPNTSKLLERKTMIDTVFWNKYDDSGNYVRNSKLPPRVTALKIASQMAGENYSKRFFASWQTVKRMYSVPPLPDFASADEYLKKGEWDSAILLWKRYVNDGKGKLAINARYNMALAYEMKDDITAAQKWLAAAMQLATRYRSKEDIRMILHYQKILTKRQKDISTLNRN